MKKNIARQIGHGLAYLQDTCDRILTFGFEKLQHAQRKTPEKNTNPLEKGARKAAGFLGEMGSEYFKKYEQIKKDRAMRTKKK